MATTSYTAGNVVQWTNGTGSDVASGAVVRVGLLGMGIATVAIANAATGSVALTGIHKLTKYGTANALTQGQKVWWDTTNGVMNAPATGRFFIGYADVAASATATTAYVRLAPFAEEDARVLTISATEATTLAVADFLSGNLVVFAPNTAAVTVTLPAIASVPVGAFLRVRKTTADAEAVTIDGNASETVAGGATFATIDANNDTALFVSTGAAWALVDSQIA